MEPFAPIRYGLAVLPSCFTRPGAVRPKDHGASTDGKADIGGSAEETSRAARG
jgi:hypothetical protein